MPIPIKPINDPQRDDKAMSDYSFLMNLEPAASPKKKTVNASNKDASLLFNLWAASEGANSETSIKITEDMGISSRELMRLKTMGFLTGSSSEVKFTSKGKIVITTMALGETNKFKQAREEKSYTEILASMNKRGKKGYRSAQYSPCTSNCLNLKTIK